MFSVLTEDNTLPQLISPPGLSLKLSNFSQLLPYWSKIFPSEVLRKLMKSSFEFMATSNLYLSSGPQLGDVPFGEAPNGSPLRLNGDFRKNDFSTFMIKKFSSPKIKIWFEPMFFSGFFCGFERCGSHLL